MSEKELALKPTNITFEETGKVKPVIDQCFPLEETAEAFRYYEAGHMVGKVVITMVEDRAQQPAV